MMPVLYLVATSLLRLPILHSVPAGQFFGSGAARPKILRFLIALFTKRMVAQLKSARGEHAWRIYRFQILL